LEQRHSLRHPSHRNSDTGSGAGAVNALTTTYSITTHTTSAAILSTDPAAHSATGGGCHGGGLVRPRGRVDGWS